MHRLSENVVESAFRPGRYCDGGGLYLVVQPGGSKSWICRVQRDGTRRDIGLGSAAVVTLADAREKARDTRDQIDMGLDPVAERPRREVIPTFRQAAARVLEEVRGTWRNKKHAAQWQSSLEAYAFPHIGNVKVNRITGPMIRNMLVRIWLEKPETARRVRQRVGNILDWSYSMGYRDSEAPMRAISKGLPRQPRQDGHFAAMPYDRVAAFIVTLRAKESFSRLALEFAILTASRSGEVRGATWDEFDLGLRLWTIPKHRMKANREHVVPLCNRAVAIVRRCAELRTPSCDLVFSGTKKGLPLSDMTLSKLLKLMQQPYTAHGFRSSFRDWVSEETNHPSDVAEAALAHLVADKTEAAYRRGKLLAKRRIMMEDWARYCEPPS
ncbi:tyrosine-type recombinase/integrase [Sphingopyxis chilensis]